MELDAILDLEANKKKKGFRNNAKSGKNAAAPRGSGQNRSRESRDKVSAYPLTQSSTATPTQTQTRTRTRTRDPKLADDSKYLQMQIGDGYKQQRSRNRSK